MGRALGTRFVKIELTHIVCDNRCNEVSLFSHRLWMRTLIVLLSRIWHPGRILPDNYQITICVQHTEHRMMCWEGFQCINHATRKRAQLGNTRLLQRWYMPCSKTNSFWRQSDHNFNAYSIAGLMYVLSRFGSVCLVSAPKIRFKRANILDDFL